MLRSTARCQLPAARRPSRGFTLIEILIAISIIGVLGAAILVAVDPVQRIQEGRDARRFSEVNGILSAILNKQVDDVAYYNGVATAPVITHATFAQVIVTSDTGVECDTDLTENYPGCNQALDVGATPATSKSCVANLSTLAPDYIGSLPIDPRGTGATICATGCTTNGVGITTLGATNTGYYVHRTAGNRLEIGACAGEQQTAPGAISVKR